MAAMKMLLADVPNAIEQVCFRIRQGIFQTFDHKILQVIEPETIDLNFEVIIRKDDLVRVETSERGPSTSTTETGEQVSNSVRSGGGSETDSTETSTTTDESTTTGGEISLGADVEIGGESSLGVDIELGTDNSVDITNDSGTSHTDMAHTSLDTGTDVQTIEYETDTGGPTPTP